MHLLPWQLIQQAYCDRTHKRYFTGHWCACIYRIKTTKWILMLLKTILIHIFERNYFCLDFPEIYSLGPSDFKSALVQVMAWCQTVDKLLPQPMLIQSTYAFVTRCPFNQQGLTLTPAWIRKHTPSKVWDNITYAFQTSKVAPLNCGNGL